MAVPVLPVVVFSSSFVVISHLIFLHFHISNTGKMPLPDADYNKYCIMLSKYLIITSLNFFIISICIKFIEALTLVTGEQFMQMFKYNLWRH